jgi:transcriptional regulator with XRE-family HTH domain
MKNNIYTTLHGHELDLASLTSEETDLFVTALKAYDDTPEWLVFEQKWLNEVVQFYDRQRLSRRETISKTLYRAVQDLGSRLMVREGLARLPGYREQLQNIIEMKFETRRQFCEVAGVSEDMLSHVLKGRKDLSIGALEELLGKIGYGLTLVPLPRLKVG